MEKHKNLFLAFTLFIFVHVVGQNDEKIEYLTLGNSTLNKTQADTLKELYKKIYFENNQIKKIEFNANYGNNSEVNMLEYYLDDNENIEFIKNKYPKSSFVFKKIKMINSFKIVTKETYDKFHVKYPKPIPIPNSINKNTIEKTVFDNKNQVIAFEGYINNKVEKENYKILYNKKGISILVCDYLRKKCTVFKDDDYLDLERQPIETFNFKEFTKLKQKYFANQDISYYENAELIPTDEFIKKYTDYNITKNAEYLTEIGTEISKNNLQNVTKYSRIKYSTNQIKEIEFFDDKKVNIEYFLNKNEDIEKVSEIMKPKYRNYTLVNGEELDNKYLKQTYYIYENGNLIDKIRKIKNQDDMLIGIEYYSKNDLTKLIK